VRALALLALAGCSTARPVVDGQRACLTWKGEMAAALSERCGACHPAGAPYDVCSYASVLVERSGTVAARAGDDQSLVLRALGDAQHAAVADLMPQLRRWVVDCNLAYERSAIHAGGIMNPADPDFHGALLRAQGWSFGLCATCHGADFSGGRSGASCLTCHSDGPTSCTTCHGQPPTSGAHAAHAAGTVARAFACSECHVTPLV
jgi:hypothetical protein